MLVPVFNERATIEEIIDLVRASPIRTEIICVDDGSTDGTADALERLLAEGRIYRLGRHTHNMGKGAAVRAALGTSTGEIVVLYRIY